MSNNSISKYMKTKLRKLKGKIDNSQLEWRILTTLSHQMTEELDKTSLKVWKLNNILLNNLQVKEEIKKQIRNHLKINDNAKQKFV